jgi:hypothetical protein
MTALLALPDGFDRDPGPHHQPVELGVFVTTGPVLVALGLPLLLQLAHAEDECYVFLGDQPPETLNCFLQRSLCRDDLPVILRKAAVNEVGVNKVVNFGIPAVSHVQLHPGVLIRQYVAVSVEPLHLRLPVHPLLVLPHYAYLVQQAKLCVEISLLSLLGEAADRVERRLQRLLPGGLQGLVGGVMGGERAAEGRER